MVRARQVVCRSTCRVVYKFPSIKLNRTIYCESGLELDYAFLLDADHGGVSFFQEQPGKIKYYLHGKPHTYTPDFYVIRPNKKQVIEVKPEARAFKEENLILFERITPICRDANCEFIVVTDMVIRVQPRLDNVKLLWKYGRTRLYPQHHIYCQEFFAQTSIRSLGEMFEFFACRKERKAIVFSLIYWGVVGVNIDAPINKDAFVHLPA